MAPPSGSRRIKGFDSVHKQRSEDGSEVDMRLVSPRQVLPPDEASKISFDYALWLRFNEIARLFFYPADVHAPGGWGLLLVGWTCGIAGGSFLVSLALLRLIRFVDKQVLREMIDDVSFVRPWPITACVGLGFFFLVAMMNKRQLRGRWRQWGMLGMLLLLLFATTVLKVYISYVFRALENALHRRKESQFYQQMVRYAVVLVLAIPLFGYYRFKRMTLSRHWRQYLCEYMLDQYLHSQAYYQLDSNSLDTCIDNPDQRLTEDVRHFCHETLDFILDLVSSVMDIASFSLVLWETSWRLVLALVLYSLTGTVLALYLGRHVVSLDYTQLQREADLRYSVVRLRENAEAIAFYGGEATEGTGIRKRLSVALLNYDRLIIWTSLIQMYQNSFFFLARLVPYLAIGGLYFGGHVEFGQVTQGIFAFHMVLDSITLIIHRIRDISRFAAGVDRLGLFYEVVMDGKTDWMRRQERLAQQRLRRKSSRKSRAPSAVVELSQASSASPAPLVDSVDLEAGAARSAPASDAGSGSSEAESFDLPVTRRKIQSSVVAGKQGVEMSAITLQTPTGRTLVEKLTLAIGTPGAGGASRAGRSSGGASGPAAPAVGGEERKDAEAMAAAVAMSRRLIIMGPSGSGKSSLLRAIAGLWNRGSGEVRRPPPGEMVFLPQKPYMPLGDLRMQLLYPNIFADMPDSELSETLCHLGLGRLPQRFPGGYDTIQDWSRVLSVGEQQRVAIARCLLASPPPTMVVLDEATSALPVHDEEAVYQLLQQRGLCYISVGHRESLLQHHDLVLEIGTGGSWRLRDPAG